MCNECNDTKANSLYVNMLGNKVFSDSNSDSDSGIDSMTSESVLWYRVLQVSDAHADMI